MLNRGPSFSWWLKEREREKERVRGRREEMRSLANNKRDKGRVTLEHTSKEGREKARKRTTMRTRMGMEKEKRG